VNVGSKPRAELLTGERVITCQISSNGNFMEVAELQALMANIRWQCGNTHSFNLLVEELGKFVGVDVS